MADSVKIIGDDDEVFTGIRPPLHRRHTLGGNSSLASDLAHAPVVWRPVMPMGRRSTLASRSETDDVGELRSTIDGSMRSVRSISDASTSSHRHDKTTFALHDVDAFSVQRAKVIRRISEERYVRFRNFFKSFEPEMAMEIQARSAFSREHLDAWVNYIVSPKVLRCIGSSKDTQQEVLDLLMVSAAISKYGESDLMAKDRRGDLSGLQNIKLHTYDEFSPSQKPQTNNKEPVAMEFVVRINERLAEERRVGGVVLREILAHAGTMEIENDEADSDLSKEEERFKQIVVRVQSDWFQDAILKANGRYLYDAIRQVISNANNSLWDASKEKPELRRTRSDRVSSEGQQVERKAVRRRPSMPPPPPPQGAMTALVSSPINASAKVGFTIYNRSSSMPSEEIQELVVGTDKTRRKLLPLGAMRRPRGLPPKLPQRKENDPIVHAPSAFVVKAQERE
ncbi:hypothetical protein PPTG_06592 [Phytophthora nicotianae INRA-310]|uniref:Uncharacterized protein n=1 Tax=Phytophthora nicotianae (strain INRA-310) TaxID=761204 RepID=W2QQU8_PHYN3|nr:hypothetical protein PPTG_06592 [Phytophthora nicotianae INRA-310]ETN15306.1 hypothetical protein PPTG_06592 [Phytophthora nicotianae INRA-310]